MGEELKLGNSDNAPKGNISAPKNKWNAWADWNNWGSITVKINSLELKSQIMIWWELADLGAGKCGAKIKKTVSLKITYQVSNWIKWQKYKIRIINKTHT